ncbi:MAG: hypothetical protein JKY62_07875 [Desulfocapsa sp.]|nr:hypothetical protein [Desulfocapsa sp.]MBN4048745.1 hypothetical protein [bacterium AH-315-N22]
MKKYPIIILVILILLPSLAAAKSVLTRINKIQNKSSIELYCSFTELPLYHSSIKGKRVDLILEKTTLKPDFTFFDTDDKIVKILSQNKNNKTILSFFFRYPPQRFDIVPNQKDNKLTVTILLGNPYSLALPDFSSRLAGLTILERTTKDFSNPLIASPYAADWKSFFTLYESKVHFSMPVQYTILPFPAMAYLLPEREENRDLLGEEIYSLARQELWHSILPLLLERITKEKDPEIKKKLALTYGDVLSRDNNFTDAFKQFYLLSEEYAEEDIGTFAKYLLILLRARFEDPFIADFEFRNLNESMTPSHPLAPYFLISQLETALATEQYSRMHDLLARDEFAYPGDTAMIRDLRQADFWYGTGDLIKAYIGYQLLEKHELLLDKTFSLNGYCDTLYQQKQYKDASRCFALLSGHIKEKERLGLISYRQYLAELHFKSPDEMVDYFARLEHTYPGTEAGFRGALKKTDLQYLLLENWDETAIRFYNALAEKSITRAGREEASFKEALVYRLMGKNIQSIELIMDFLRNFRNGELYHSAQALLIELFPLVITEYVASEQYMEALILAKKNRKLFLKNWVDIALLAKIAGAYNSLGIYQEASKLYLYLIALSSEDRKEQYYVPLMSAAYDHGAYDVVEDYSDQYSFRYPDGAFKTEILILRIKSMLAEERYQDAVKILPETIPATEEFSLLASTLYFHENNFAQVVEILDRQVEITDGKLARSTFMLAESLYQLNRFNKSKSIFSKIPRESTHHDQAQFRLAELLKKDGQSEASLTIYKDLVETGKNPLWVRLAKKELELNDVLQ